MGIIKRQGFKATIVTYVGTLIGALTTLFVFPYFLTPELIGLTRIMIDSAIFFSFFAQFGISNAIIKFHSMLHSNEERKQFLWYIAIFPIISFSFCLILFIAFQDVFINIFASKSPVFNLYIIWVIPLAFMMMYITILEAYASTQYRITIPKIIREIIIRVLMIFSIIAFALLNLSADNYIFMIVATYMFAAMFNILYISFGLKIKFPKINLNVIKISFLKKMGSYMLFMVLGGIGANLITRMDIFMISSMSGLAQTGVYSIAFFMAAVIEIPFRSTVQIAGPILSEALNSGNISKVCDLYKRNALNQLIISLLIMLVIWVNIDNIFLIMPNGHLYQGGKYVLLFIGLSKIYDVVTGLNNHIIVYSKYYKTALIWIIGLAATTIISNYLLIPIYGITGAAIATLISVFGINSIVVLFIYMKLKIHPFSLVCLKTIPIFLICITIHYFMPRIVNPFADIIIRSSLLVGIYGILIYFTKISPDINDMIIKLTSKIKFYKKL